MIAFQVSKIIPELTKNNLNQFLWFCVFTKIGVYSMLLKQIKII